MSGRDLKKFVNYHRTAIGASDNTLVTRLVDGHASKQYKSIDYGKLHALAQVKRAAGDRALQKIEKISEARKISKEHNLMQQHKSCWFKEQIRLNSQMKKLRTEIDGLRPGSPLDHTSLKEFFQDLEIYEGILREETNEFQRCTIDPIRDLREDLQYWLGENRERLLIGGVDKEHSDVLNVVSSVKQQQMSVIDRLRHEENILEDELESFYSKHMIVIPSLVEVKSFKTGIPEEALDLDCPDQTLKETVLEEFKLLDKKYEAHLEYLAVKYEEAVGSPYGKWSRYDHSHFTYLMDQYPAEMPNRRALYIDRMLREMPHKGRSQLVEHENWCLMHKSYQNQRHSVLQAWSRDRKDLFAKVEAIFSDAWDAHEQNLEKKLAMQQQEKICHELYAKVLAFREQKLEALELQAAITARQAEKEKELLKAAQLKEKQRREKIKEQVKVFEEQKAQEREKAAVKEKLRLEELQARMAEQALLDRERVDFRKQKQKEKDEVKKQAALDAIEEEHEKQRRLAKLREQATQARFASTYDEELELQQPLFTVHGYKDRKVSSDPRLRVEQALRDAGLHQTDYARRIMATIKPPQEPRKDQQSTVFKYG